MKAFSEYKNTSDNIKESAERQYTLFPKDKKELKQMIKDEIRKQGNEADLNHIDVSGITDFSELFKESRFNGDISRWDVSNVTDMHDMFYNAKSFNQDISEWDVSNVTNMKWMFPECPCPEEYQPKFK